MQEPHEAWNSMWRCVPQGKVHLRGDEDVSSGTQVSEMLPHLSIQRFFTGHVWSDLWCEKERETDRETDRKTKKLRRRPRNGKEDVKKKREKRLLRSLLLTILERSAVARATSGTRDWYLEQRSSGIAAEDLMFGTHLGSTNTSHLFSCFSDTLPASSLQPTLSPYHETPRGWCPIFFYCFTLVLHEP